MAGIVFKDKQVQITAEQLKLFPYNCIFILEVKFQGDISSVSTGFLIASNLLLTSSHTLFSSQLHNHQINQLILHSPSKDIRMIIPKQNARVHKKYSEYKNMSKKEKFPKQTQFDFSLIKLPESINMPKYFTLKRLSQKNKQQVTVCGVVQLSEKQKFILYQASNIIEIDNITGYYDIDTRAGQAGSPVFCTQTKQVIGIHKGSKKNQRLGFCCPVTDHLLQTIQGWKKQFGLDQQQEQQIYQNQSCLIEHQLNQFKKYENQSNMQFDIISLKQQKIDFSKLQFIKFKGKQFQGVNAQQICKLELPNLKEIDLTDIDITLSGVVQLIYNKWNENVTYVLDCVRKTKDCYLLNVGQNIPIIKSFIKEGKVCQDRIDSYEDSKKLYQAIYLMMQLPFQKNEKEEIKQSHQIEEEMKKTIENQKDSTLDRLLLTLKKNLGDSRTLFTENTTIKSQLAWRMITLEMMNKRVMIKHKIEDKNWNFKNLHYGSQQIRQFKDYYLKGIAQKYTEDIKDISIHKLTEGSIDVWLSVDLNNFLIKNPQFSNERISVVPFFSWFQLSPDDFDSFYSYEYPETNKVQHQFRGGGIPFFSPIHCKKFAIKVQDLYDRGDNTWLQSFQQPGSWAIAFHGITQPSLILPSLNKTVLRSIMDGRSKGQMLKAGAAQAYESQKAINKPNQLVGRGIYLSPYFTTCLELYAYSTCVADQTYKAVLMVRIRPQALKITSEQTYWVINESRDLRPCGILLFTPEQSDQLVYKKKEIYGQEEINQPNQRPCHWQRWKDSYLKFRDKNNLQ